MKKPINIFQFIACIYILSACKLYSQIAETEQQVLFSNSIISLHEYYERLENLESGMDKIQNLKERDSSLIRRILRELLLMIPYKTKLIIQDETNADSLDGELILNIDHSWFVFRLEELYKGDGSERLSFQVLLNQVKSAKETAGRLIENGNPMFPKNYMPAINEIKSRKEFQPHTEKENQNLLTEFFRWLAEQIEKFLKNLIPEGITPSESVPLQPYDLSGIGNFVVFLFYIIGGILLLFTVYRLYKLYRNRKKESGEDADDVLLPILEPGEPSEPDYHQEKASQYELSGDYRKALRHQLLSVLLYLDKKNIVRLLLYRTNTEYLLSIQDMQDLIHKDQLLKHLNLLFYHFDRAWWGLKTIDSGLYDLCKESANRIRSEFKNN